MDKRAIRFFKNDAYLKEAIERGKDVYSAFAARFFNCEYDDCVEYNPKSGEPNPVGQYRRKVAKFILCSMFFSTKRRWHKHAFEMISEVPHFIEMVAANEK